MPTLPNLSYASTLNDLHTAFAIELRAMVNALPLPLASRVLDAPCGDGFYARALAHKIGRDGSVVALDSSEEYLEGCRAIPAEVGDAAIDYQAGDMYALPFADQTFDLVWCAQSMISLKEPVAALKELYRVVRPGGVVAVLENDEHHHVILPWPVEMEPALLQALPAASNARYGKASTLFASRYLRRMIRSAGLKPLQKRTITADRHAPFDTATQSFLESHLASLRSFVEPYLEPPTARNTFLALTDPEASSYLLNREDLEFTWMGAVHFGVRVD